jgi:hypothetical protein
MLDESARVEEGTGDGSARAKKERGREQKWGRGDELIALSRAGLLPTLTRSLY